MNFKKNYYLNDLSLVLTEESHIKELLNYSTNKKFYKYLEYIHFSKKDSIIYYKKKIKNKKIILFTIFFKKKIVGTFSINNLNLKEKKCFIGYGINPKYWGQGIFKNLIKLVISKKFNNGLLKINVLTREDNYPSISGLIKNNFRIIKVLINYYHDKKTKKKYNAIKLQWIKK
jgi:RimJ/RimL family protein N-acetyltransferase